MALLIVFYAVILYFGIRFIMNRYYKESKNVSIQDKMQNDLITEKQFDKVKEFQKEHKRMDKKQEIINKFTEGGN